MTIKISDMTLTTVDGTEIIPTSKSNAARSVTAAGIRNFIVDHLKSIESGTEIDGAEVFLKRGGELKPVPIDTVVGRALAIMWDKADVASPSTGKLPVKEGSIEKTITLANLAVFVRDTIRAAVLDVSTLNTASAVHGVDNLLVVQGSTAKKTTVNGLVGAIYDGLAGHVEGKDAVSQLNNEDVLYIVQGGTARKVTVANFKTAVGDVVFAPATTTENKVPQWGQAQKTLKDGLAVRVTVRDTGDATHTALPTESAVRNAIMAQGTNIQEVLDSLHQHALSIDPYDPLDGQHVIWQSDGTESGDAGDIMIKITVGEETKTATLVDFSEIA